MKKEQFVTLGLSEELATKAAEASQEELKVYIPKERFDEVNNTNKQLKTDLTERNTQLEELKKTAGLSEELKKQIETLQTENTKKQTDFETKIKQMQIDTAVEKALTGAKAKNAKAVKALLDLQNAEIDGDSIKGLGDQLKKLQEADDTKFLFDDGQQSQQFKGFKPGQSGGLPSSLDSLNAQYQEALKAGNTVQVVMLKNKIFEETNKKIALKG